MLSLKERGQSLYESTRSSTGLSGIGGLRASQPAAGGSFLNKIAQNVLQQSRHRNRGRLGA